MAIIGKSGILRRDAPGRLAPVGSGSDVVNLAGRAVTGRGNLRAAVHVRRRAPLTGSNPARSAVRGRERCGGGGMDAYRRRLPRPLRRLLGVPIAPAAGLAWLGHRVLLRVVRRRTKPEETALWRAWAVHSLRHGQLVIARMAAEYIVAAEPDAPDGYYLLHRAYPARRQARPGPCCPGARPADREAGEALQPGGPAIRTTLRPSSPTPPAPTVLGLAVSSGRAGRCSAPTIGRRRSSPVAA
jgi:hypothetical protein